jgi:hypothetical protein
MTGTGTGFMGYFGSYVAVNKTVLISNLYRTPDGYTPVPPARDEIIERAERKLLRSWGAEYNEYDPWKTTFHRVAKTSLREFPRLRRTRSFQVGQTPRHARFALTPHN